MLSSRCEWEKKGRQLSRPTFPSVLSVFVLPFLSFYLLKKKGGLSGQRLLHVPIGQVVNAPSYAFPYSEMKTFTLFTGFILRKVSHVCPSWSVCLWPGEVA